MESRGKRFCLEQGKGRKGPVAAAAALSLGGLVATVPASPIGGISSFSFVLLCCSQGRGRKREGNQKWVCLTAAGLNAQDSPLSSPHGLLHSLGLWLLVLVSRH